MRSSPVVTRSAPKTSPTIASRRRRASASDGVLLLLRLPCCLLRGDASVDGAPDRVADFRVGQPEVGIGGEGGAEVGVALGRPVVGAGDEGEVLVGHRHIVAVL